MSDNNVLTDLQGEITLPNDVTLADIVPTVAGTALESAWLEGATVAPVEGGGLRITTDLPDLHLHAVVIEIPAGRDGLSVTWAAPQPLSFPPVEWLSLTDAAMTMRLASSRLTGELSGVLNLGGLALPLAVGLPPPATGWVLEPTFERISVADMAALAGSFGVPDLADRFPAELSSALDKVAITGLRVHYQPRGNKLRAFAVDLEVDTTWELVAGLAIERPTLALSVLNPASQRSREVHARLSASLRLGELRLPVSVSSSAGAYTVEIEADEITIPSFTDLAALVGPAVELPVDLPELRISGVSIGVDAERRAQLAVSIAATLAGTLPGFPAVGMSGFEGSFAVDAGVLSGSLTGGLTLGDASLALAVERADAAAQWRFTAASTPDSGPLNLSAALSSLLDGVGLPQGLPDFGLANLALEVTPKLGAFAFSADVTGAWTVPVGVAELVISEVKVAIARAGSGQPSTCSVRGKLTLAGVTMAIGAPVPGGLVLAASAPGLRPWAVIESLCGDVFDAIPIPDQIRDLVLDPCTITIDPNARTLAIRGAAAGFGAIELHAQRDARGAWGAALALAPAGGADLGALLGVQGLGGLSLSDVVFVLSSLHAPALRFTAPQFAAVLGVTRGFGFSTKVGLAELGVGQIPGLPTTPLAVQARFGRTLADFSLAAAMAAPGGRFVIDPASGLALIDPELRIAPATGEVVIGGRVDVVLDGERLEFTGGFKLAGGAAALFATMKGDWREPFAIRGVIARALSVELRVPGVPSLAGTLVIGGRAGTLAIKPDPAAPVLDLWLESLDLHDILASVADLALADVPAAVRRTIADVRFADVRIYIAPRATTLGAVQCPAGVSLRGKMFAWGLEVAARVETREVGGLKALVAEGAMTMPPLGDHLVLRGGLDEHGVVRAGPYFKLNLEPGTAPRVVIEAAVEVLGISVAAASVHLDDSGFAVALQGALFGGAVSAALEVRGGSFGPTAKYGVTATLDVGFLQSLLSAAIAALTAVVTSASAEIDRARALLTTIEQKGQAIDAASETRRQEIKAQRDADAARLRSAEADLQTASARVHALSLEVDAARATVAAERAAVERRIAAAQADVSAATAAVNNLTHEINATNRWFYGLPKVAWPWIASQAREGTWYGIKIGGLYAARETATGVLNAARQALQAVVDAQRTFPIDLDPRVAGLLVALNTATAGLAASQSTVAALRQGLALVPADADFRLLALSTAREALNVQMVAARTALDLAEGALDGIAALGAALIPSVRIDRASFACDLSVAAGGIVRMSVDVTTSAGSRNFAIDLDLHDPMRCATELINVLMGTDSHKAIAAVAQSNDATVVNVKEIERAALPNDLTVVLRSLSNQRLLAVRRQLRYGDTICLRTSSSHHLREIGGGVDAWQNHESGPECRWTIVKPSAPSSTELVRYGDQVALRSHVNTYLVAEDFGPVNANRGAIGPWEHWTLFSADDVNSRAAVDLGREVALRSWRSLYLGAHEDGFNGGRVYADRTAIGAWESWVIVNKTGGTVVRADGTGALDPACQFTLKRSGDWIGLLSTATGRYVSVQPDSRVHADSPNFTDAGHTWERFRLEGDYLFNQGQGRYLRLGDGDTAVMQRIGGSLKHVDCGADGAVWGVNSGGYIYRWLGGHNWEEIAGSLRMVSVGSATQVWGVNDNNNIFRWLGGHNWEQKPGGLRNVEVAADGTVWGVGPDDRIYRWNGSSWNEQPGRARQVAVGSASEVWCVTQDDGVYRWNGSSWNVMPGRLRQISVAADGTVCGVTSANEACRWQGTDWRVFASNTLQVGVGTASLLWAVTLDLQIDRTVFDFLPGDVVDGAATSQGPRAAFEIGRAVTVSNSVNSVSANPGPPQYSATDLQTSTLQKEAVTSGAAAGEGPAAEQAAAVQATATRAAGDGAVAPVLGVEAAAEVDRRARRQRMIEKAGSARPEIVEAVRDSALRFDGASYLEAPAQRPVMVEGVVGSAPTIALGARFTVEAWIAPERLGDGERAIVSKWSQGADDEFLVMLAADGRLVVAWHVDGASGWGAPGWNSCTSSEAVKLDAWTHVAAVRDGDRITLYIDGRAVGRAEGLGDAPLRPGARPWRIGAERPGGRAFVGLIDSVRIWDQAASAASLRARRFLVARGDEAGLLACWNMDEASGDITFDAGPRELHARLVGQVQRACPGGPEGPPLTDRHLTLAGHGYVHVGDVDLITTSTAMTIEAWVLVDSIPADLAAIVDKWIQSPESEYRFAIDPAGRLNFAWRCQGSTTYGTPAWNHTFSVEAVPFGRWCHVAVVRDGRSIRFFRDGALIGASEAATDQPLHRSTAPLCLGSEGGTTRAFVGSLAEIRIWRIARTDAAIRDTHRRPLVGDEPDLVALWRLDEGWGASLRDAGPQARHGALMGTATWPPRGGPPRIVGPTRGVRLAGAHYLEFGDDDLFSASIAITIESWVRIDALTEDFSSIVNKWTTSVDDEYLLAIARDGHLAFAWHSQGAETYGTPGWNHVLSEGTIALDRWTHVAVVRAGRSVTFFIDGAPAGSSEVADLEPLRNGPAPLRVGAHGPDVGRYLRGDLAGVRIWRVARTAQELAASMAGLVSSRAPGRVLDLRFDECEGTAVLDAASGRTGVAVGVDQPPPANIPVILPVYTQGSLAVDDTHDPRRPAIDAARRCLSRSISATSAIPEVEAALAQIERATPGAVLAVMAAALYPPDELGRACVSAWGHDAAAVARAFFAGERSADEALQGLQAALELAGGASDTALLTLCTAAGYSPEAIGSAFARAKVRTAHDVAQLYRTAGLPSALAARATAEAMPSHTLPSPASLAHVLLASGHAPAAIGELLARRWGADGSTIARAVQRAGGTAAATLAAVEAGFAVAPPPADRSVLSLLASLVQTPADVSGVPGGPEGGGFADDLAAVRRITRIEVRYSHLVNGLRLTWEGPGGATIVGPWRGSQADNLATIDLAAGETVVKVALRSGWFVDQIAFHTSAGRVFGPYGGNGGTPFAFSPLGHVLGFYGRAHHVISALGVALRCDGSGIFGGGGGQLFLDDLTGAERLRRVTIRHGASIDAIQLHWIDRAGALVDGPRHGGGGGTESSFELADDERIVSVAGYSGNVVNHLAFTTNKGNRHIYGTPAGAMFSFRIERSARILGLCGRAGVALDAFGLCVVPTGVSGLADAYLHLRDTKHGLCLVAGDVHDGNVYHQQPGGRSNALWKLEPVGADRPDVYRIKDSKHGKYLVAGDVHDGNLYHQDHQDRLNACWKLVRSVDQGREVYQLIDEKHHKAIVAGDVADNDVYHQDPQDRRNARWTLVDPA